MAALPPRAQRLRDRLDRARDRTAPLYEQWRNNHPSTFLSSESREALGDKIRRLGVNYVRLAVTSVAERLNLVGMMQHGADAAETWHAFRDGGGPRTAELVHIDRALYGAAYVTVWADSVPGAPRILGDSARTMAVERDPLSGSVLMALRQWREDGKRYAATIEPSRVITYEAPEAGGWQTIAEDVNPLGIVPVVPMVRSMTLEDRHGTSVAADILDLVAALAKVMADAMVSSEYYAKPRRWATGLEIQEDDEGNPVDPFGSSRLLQSESPDTKFGQLEAASLSSYADLVATITQQIGAITGLPPHYLGLHGDQPASAEGVRAAEAQLVERIQWEQRRLASSWGQVAALVEAVRTGGPVGSGYWPVWANPEQRTPAQAADAAVKLAQIGLPLGSLLRDPLRYSPEEAAEILRTRNSDLGALLGSRGLGL